MAAEIEIATCSAARFGFGEVRSVTPVDLEAHVARMEANGGLGFGGAVVQKVGDGLGFGLGIFSGGQGTKSYQHGGIDGTCIVEERADDFL